MFDGSIISLEFFFLKKENCDVVSGGGRNTHCPALMDGVDECYSTNTHSSDTILARYSLPTTDQKYYFIVPL